MDFFWVAHAGIRSQPKWKKKQLHLRKHTHTQRQSYVFQYGCQLVENGIGATLHSLVQGNPGSSIALRAIERFP